jgi:transposase-like protein
MGSTSGSSAPAGYRFPREVIAVAVRWYLRYALSYRDVEELLAERGIEVDHVTVYRWVQTFTAEFIDAARPARHVVGNRCFLDETYVKVAGCWIYLYRAVDQHGQVIKRAGLAPPGRGGRAGVVCSRVTARPGSGRGHHRPGAGLSARAG